MNAVHRAGVNTGPVATARLGNHMRHRRAASDLRGGDHVLSLRFAAVATGAAVDLADAPEDLGDRVDQAGVVAQHPDFGERKNTSLRTERGMSNSFQNARGGTTIAEHRIRMISGTYSDSQNRLRR